jgi:hypothetical protein
MKQVAREGLWRFLRGAQIVSVALQAYAQGKSCFTWRILMQDCCIWLQGGSLPRPGPNAPHGPRSARLELPKIRVG